MKFNQSETSTMKF